MFSVTSRVKKYIDCNLHTSLNAYRPKIEHRHYLYIYIYIYIKTSLHVAARFSALVQIVPGPLVMDTPGGKAADAWL
jgi:hypothetical protein